MPVITVEKLAVVFMNMGVRYLGNRALSTQFEG